MSSYKHNTNINNPFPISLNLNLLNTQSIRQAALASRHLENLAGTLWLLLSPLSQPQSTNAQNQSLQTKHNTKRNHSTNDTSNSIAHTTLLGLTNARTLLGRVISSALPGLLPTSLAPLLAATLERNLVHLSHERSPWELRLVLPENGVGLGGVAIGGSAVGEQEADKDLILVRGGRGSGLGEQLESHGAGVIDDGSEVLRHGGQLGEAEEGGESAVGAELDVELLRRGRGDGGLEGGDDVRGQDGAGDGADGRGGVVGEAELVDVGEVGEGLEGGRGEEVGGGDGGVVNGGDVDVVVD